MSCGRQGTFWVHPEVSYVDKDLGGVTDPECLLCAMIRIRVDTRSIFSPEWGSPCSRQHHNNARSSAS